MLTLNDRNRGFLEIIIIIMIKDIMSIVYVNKILGYTYSHTMLQLICMNYCY